MPLFGKDAVLYYSSSLKTSDSDADSMSWDDEDNVADLTDNFTSTDVDITTRATAKLGWEASASVLKSGEIRWSMQAKHGDTFVDAILSAWLNSTPIALMDLSADQETEGAFGLAANFSISLTHAKPVKGVQILDVTAKIYDFPEWVVSEGS